MTTLTTYTFGNAEIRVLQDENVAPSYRQHNHTGNNPLIALMFEEDPPTIKRVIEARNMVWASGMEVDVNLYANLMTLAVRHRVWCREEWQAYPCVAEHLGGKVLGGASQPDVQLSDGTPVEIKQKSFDDKALRQLKRYMKAAGTDRGIACAETLDTDLPDTIGFIPIRFNVNANKYEVVNA